MFSRLAEKLRALFRQQQIHDEIAAEREFHMAMTAAHLERQGLSESAAKREAASKFGRALPLHEDAFAARAAGLPIDVYNDFRFALRVLAKTPARTAAMLATLALGIGVNVAVFSITKWVLYEPLPFLHANDLVSIHQISKDGVEGVSYPNFEDWRTTSKSFESMAIYAADTSALRVGNQTQRSFGVIGSANLFPLLGVKPVRGRLFNSAEDQPHSPHVVLISDRLWRERFQAREDILGQTLALDGIDYRIIGIFPEQESFPIQKEGVDYSITISIDAEPSPWGGSVRMSRGFPRYDAAIARLLPGVSLQQAHSEMKLIAARIAGRHPQFDLQRGVQMAPAVDDAFGKVRPLFWILFSATCCVWAISCANVATLFLVEALGRSREFALRAALGAAQTHMIRQLLVESLTVSVLGGAAGLALASALVSGTRKLALLSAPRVANAHLDSTALAYAIGASLLAGLAFGLAPALLASRRDLSVSLKQFDSRAFAGKSIFTALRFQPGVILILAQVAICMVLCCAAIVLSTSFWKILHQPRGFDSNQVLTAAISLPVNAFPLGSDKVTQFYYQLLDEVRQTAGVTAASVAQSLPLSGQNNETQFEVVGGNTPQHMTTDLRFVDPSYFETLRIPLLHGSLPSLDDRRKTRPVAVVNEEFVRRFLSRGNAIGTRVLLGWGGAAPKTIIGVVGGIRHQALSAQIRPEVYVPIAQFPVTDLSLVIRTGGTTPRLAQQIRDVVHKFNQDATVDQFHTLDDYLILAAAPQRLLMWLLIAFSLNALALAAIGLYGSLSYAALARQREFGIRMALGSTATGVIGTVVRHGLTIVALGLILGILMAAATAPLLRSWLFEIEPLDAPSLFFACILLLGIASLACWLPARRASLADPSEALRANQ